MNSTTIMDIEQLKIDLKTLIVEECDKDVDPQSIEDNEALIRGNLDLDSLDVLQICMEVKNRYGVRIEGSADARRALKSVQTLAETIIAKANA